LYLPEIIRNLDKLPMSKLQFTQTTVTGADRCEIHLIWCVSLRFYADLLLIFLSAPYCCCISYKEVCLDYDRDEIGTFL
jgi:hypothetical protein